MRGCACRGDSAGFVHLECLTKLAMSKEESGDTETLYNGWNKCGNCKQNFRGALALEIYRRFWRRYRSSQRLRYYSTRTLATSLGLNGEVDAASQLLDEALTYVGNNTGTLLDMKLLKAIFLVKYGQYLEALELLQSILPEAKVDTANPNLYFGTLQELVEVFLGLDRNPEAHDRAVELVAFATAKFDLEDAMTLKAKSYYAWACARLGRLEEAKANFDDVVTIQTRVFGRDHSDTQFTWQIMRDYGFAEPSG